MLVGWIYLPELGIIIILFLLDFLIIGIIELLYSFTSSHKILLSASFAISYIILGVSLYFSEIFRKYSFATSILSFI